MQKKENRQHLSETDGLNQHDHFIKILSKLVLPVAFWVLVFSFFYSLEGL